ncbi:uncharacterized protein LOC107413113 isoform X1 [Ziziphus jujuba]|uniref:Uncharacterized protein LOC107413113 isoform X1 n=1 Tax=Ziziphus jujuba TaxID=326968 RepID=A0A6P3ZE31_ZIZJJ|nr:uncharacterized protein LOC107413113 isoform X1 [Ziziphus jujuba]
MTDFPPNPEDGELWLPSDVFHEIAYSNMTLATSTPTNNNNKNNGGAGNINHHAPHFLVHQPNIASPAPTSLPYPPPYFHQVFPSGDPNGIGSIGNGVPIFNNHYDSYASWNGVFQLFPGSIHYFHPFAPTQFQGFVECPNWPLQEITSAKCEGTGVFLPRSTEHHHKPQKQVVVQKSDHNQIVVNHQELEESSGGEGTGVFLNQQVHVITAPKKKKSKLQIKLA